MTETKAVTMEKAFEKIEQLAVAIKHYADAKVNEVKLTAAEKTSGIVANLVAGAVVAVVFLFFICFAGIALALALASVTGKAWLGFLIVSGIYLLAAIITWVTRERIIRIPLINAMIRQLFNKEANEED